MPNVGQPTYYSDGIDPVRRSAPEQLFLVTIEARPEPGAEEYGQDGGASLPDGQARLRQHRHLARLQLVDGPDHLEAPVL
jgi:hypothetical protein